MQSLDIENVKIIRLVSGEEICCKIDGTTKELPDKSRLLRILNPMLIKYIPQLTERGVTDYIALVKWVGFTNDTVITLPINKIITICNATPEFNNRYTQIVGKLHTIKENLPSYIERDLSKEELEEENNIEPTEDYDKEITDKNDIKELSELLNMPSKKIH
jgi:hypothetical protein